MILGCAASGAVVGGVVGWKIAAAGGKILAVKLGLGAVGAVCGGGVGALLCIGVIKLFW